MTTYGREVAHRHIFADVNDVILLDRNRMHWVEVAHRHIFSDVNDLMLPDRNPMRCEFGCEVTHCHIFSDVKNFIVRVPHALEEGSTLRVFR